MAPKTEPPRISLLGKLGLIPIFFVLVGQAIFATLTGVFVRKEDRPPTYFKYVLFSIMHTFFSLSTSAQEHWLLPTTIKVYRQFCRMKKLPEQTQLLSDNVTKLHWIGQKDADHVLLYFHGGGYNLSATIILFLFLQDLIQHAKHGGKDLGVAVLEYELAPYGTYPRQLEQAGRALGELLKDRPAATILLGGDSAGGHLLIDVLLHLLQPHPDPSVPKVNLAAGQKLKAAILISPWVEPSVQADSYRRNRRKDVLSAVSLVKHSARFRNGKPADQYLEPLRAPAGVWKCLNDIVEAVYICSGSDELIVDDIIKFQEIVRAEWTGPAEQFQYVEVPDEPHEACMIDRAIWTKDIKSDRVIKGWIKKALST